MDAATGSAMLLDDDVFVDLVSFKWLMTGLGLWVDLPRLRHDAAYASECALRGLSARSSVLQQRSRDLLAMLNPPLPVTDQRLNGFYGFEKN
jgi:hypothetical protein